MPGTGTQSGLQGVVVRRADTVELIDIVEIRVLGPERLHKSARGSSRNHLIYVKQDRQVSPFGAHIAHLPNRRPVAEALLDVQVIAIEIRSMKVVVDGINVKNRISAAWIGGNVTARAQLDTGENILARLPRVASGEGGRAIGRKPHGRG